VSQKLISVFVPSLQLRSSSVPLQFGLIIISPPPEISQLNFMGGGSKFTCENGGGGEIMMRPN